MKINFIIPLAAFILLIAANNVNAATLAAVNPSSCKQLKDAT